MTEDDLVKTMEWARTEKWDPGDADALSFPTTDEEGFFMGHLEGEPIVAVSAVRYGEKHGFIGLYICKPQYRGRGHGLAVFQRGMEHLEGRVVGLDAVAAQRSNYEKQGFVLAFQTIRFEGTLAAVVDDHFPEASTSSATAAAAAAAPPPGDGGGGGGDGSHVSIQKVEGRRLVDLVVEFDNEHIMTPRERFARAWLATPGHISRVAINGDGTVAGYGVLRPSHGSAKVGPLFAHSVEVAEKLLRAMAAGAPPLTKILLDVPEPNVDAVALAERMGLSRLWETGRMYRGPAPSLPLEHIFGFTSLELG